MVLIQSVFKKALQTYSSIKDANVFSKEVSQLASLCSSLTAEDFNFFQQHFEVYYEKRNVSGGYAHITENDLMSMGIFSLRKYGCIPLHDHPDMYGIIKVISGSIKVRSFTLLESAPCKPSQKILSSLPKRVSPSQLICTRAERPKVVSYLDSEVIQLSPKIGNFHEICAINEPKSDSNTGAAFVDILSPPYNSANDCHFFNVAGVQETSAFPIAWLYQIDSDGLFPTISLPYSGPKVKQT